MIGVVGSAGAGCTTVVNRLRLLLEAADVGYAVHVVKLSALIERKFKDRPVPAVAEGVGVGPSKFERVKALQNLGDELRGKHGGRAVASLAVREIMRLRGEAEPGEGRIAILLDSIKHSDEVQLLQEVYGHSFRLVAVHCEPGIREGRLIGGPLQPVKYGGVPRAAVCAYMDRDEKDRTNKNGQQVRDAFHLADFFVDNNTTTRVGENLNEDLQRFCDIVLGIGLARPTRAERAISHAYTAAKQSSCLSRQVGAALTASDGTVVSTGTNDPPAFGGGVYDEDSRPDHRCNVWSWKDGDVTFTGCHNTRKKLTLRKDIVKWLSATLSADLAEAAYPRRPGEADLVGREREQAQKKIVELLADREEVIEDMPGVKEIIEYSRSIHAEMDALFSAARKGVSTVGTTLYSTVYPCHNCARHLVTAGVSRVFYVEPYVKSLATELHSDAIITELPVRRADGSTPQQERMIVVPFTGVGERMYEDYFLKKGDLKDASGRFVRPAGGTPEHAVRLRDLTSVEQSAASIVPEA